MLATFVIGLREGLEAALIVGIIAAFLRRNGRPLRPMMIGVVAAVLVSLAVGVSLTLLEASLPQAQQEALETVIGVVAVVFVSGMVIWMSTHARQLKGELEHQAADALGSGSTTALALMAFLAVLKEGFETSVFLLATFSASTNTALAATGAVLGLAVAVGIGYGLYTGGMRLNLGRFFTLTSAFLVLVAAGLVVSTISTAHEAGWIDAGQQRTVDLGWLAAPGTITGAIFSGLLGIPADPRLIEVVGWFVYVIPMSLFLFWPANRRPDAATGVRIRYTVAAALAVLAAGLAVLITPATLPAFGPAPLVDAAGNPAGSISVSGTTATLATTNGTTTLSLGAAVTEVHAGVPDATRRSAESRANGGEEPSPATITLEQLVALSGGRLPVGISPQTAAGPYRASRSATSDSQLWLVGDEVLDFTSTQRTTLTLSGGGLTTPRTVTVSGTLPDGSTVTSGTLGVEATRTQAVAAAAAAVRIEAVERQFWGRTFPLGLALAAGIVLAFAWRARRRLAPASDTNTEAPAAAPLAETRREVHVS